MTAKPPFAPAAAGGTPADHATTEHPILVVDFGLRKGGFEDGQKIEDIDLLRSKPSKNEIVFRKINW